MTLCNEILNNYYKKELELEDSVSTKLEGVIFIRVDCFNKKNKRYKFCCKLFPSDSWSKLSGDQREEIGHQKLTETSRVFKEVPAFRLVL